MKPRARDHEPSLSAFTLVEMLTVLAVAAVLMTLLFTGIGAAKEAARRAQAKSDLLRLVSAIQAYYAEYGRYPIAPPSEGPGTEVTFATDNSDLLYTLRALPKGSNTGHRRNPRRIIFLEVRDAADSTQPRNGLANDIWYDPWGPQSGKPESGVYHVRIDGTYRNIVSDPYPGEGQDEDEGGPPATLPHGVIAWSLARTGVQTYELRDQVLSWK
jgi:prepilin-type N-terminal cleavage/methylation domain-containing protein